MSILGNRVLRKEDPKFLTVGATYVEDLRDERLDGAAYVTFVRSTMAHARVAGIDTDEARRAPGVVAVVTGADLDVEPRRGAAMVNQDAVRWPLAKDVVRFVGEAVAVVVTEHRYQGEDAAELVVVDYEPLPVVVDPEAALGDEVVLHAEAGTNVVLELGGEPDPAFFDGCEVVVRQRIVNQRVAIAPLEGRSAAAVWGGDRLTMWLSTQAPQAARDSIEAALRLEAGAVHVIAPDVGGGFGGKGPAAAPEEVVVAWLARQLERPVRWTETRTENMLAMGHGRAQVQYAAIGGDRDGTVTAYALDVVQDAGAYPAIGSFLPSMTRLMATGVYAIPKLQYRSRSALTNTTPLTMYRGAGRPEAAAAIERMMDLFATELGMDPAEVRHRNLIPADAFPYTTPSGSTYDCGDYGRALELVLEAAGYDALRAEQQHRRTSGDVVQVGIGVAVYVEITAGPAGGKETAKVEVRSDGSAVVYTGTSPHGQGHVTAWSMIASEELGIPIDRIGVIHGDTDLVPVGQGTMGSRSLQLGGAAVHQAAIELVELARQCAADALDAKPDDVVLDKVDGRFHLAGTPAVGRTWAELAVAAGSDGGSGLVVDAVFRAAAPTYPFGAHVAVVEVDTETGKVVLRRLVTVDDAGRVLNPLIAEGQRHGGIAQGAAQALCEEFVYDDDGNPLTATLADYAFISACELPSFELVPMETPTPMNPLGAKGIGESGTVGATPAVHNAVVDALAHLGVRHVDMPCTPQRVWQAIQEAQSA